jgi:hypothetical protein
MRSAAALLIVACAAWCSERCAFANEGARATLVYDQGPPECPDATAFRRLVFARLGYDPFVDAQALRVSVAFRASADGPRASFSVTRGAPQAAKERRADGETCASLASSVATTLAMALDPIAATGPVPAPAEPLPSLPPATPAPTPVVATPAPMPMPAGRSWTGHVSLALGAGFGELPGVGLGGTAAFELRSAPFGLRLDARGAFPATPYASTQGDAIGSSLALFGPAACLFSTYVGACAHLRTGVLRAVSETVARPAERTGWVVEAALSASALLPVERRTALTLTAELGVPANPTVFRISGDDVWRAPPFLARVLVGGTLRVF